MKRWFAQVQVSWSAPSTWRRLHRTAFAIRKDIFEEAGPFEPEYGQFAPPLPGRRLGLPLFSVGFEPDDRDGLFPRP